MLRESCEGQDLPYPHLCYRRRKDSGRMDHITDIKIVPGGGNIPDGYVESYADM